MGGYQSVSNGSKLDHLIESQIDQIENGTIPPFSYRIFLHNFHYVSNSAKFYLKLSFDKQLKVLEDIGPLTKKECITFVENTCLYVKSIEELEQKFRQISEKMICQTKINGRQVYLPVGLDKNLWKSIFVKNHETACGIYKMKNSIDWDSEEIATNRDNFIRNHQNNIPQINHSKDLSIVISNNCVDNFWIKGIDIDNISPKIDKKASKPFHWNAFLYDACYCGKISSVRYSLSLLPQLLNLPNEHDCCPVHFAASGGQKKLLIYLYKIGADFHIQNSDGILPIHYINDASIIKSMYELGLDINEKNAAGETIFDIRTTKFDKKVIKTMIGLGVNILEPYPDGSFWIQRVLYNKYYDGIMKKPKFLSFARKLLISNKEGDWNNNPIYNEVIKRKGKKQIEEDLDDLNKSVLNQDIPRISVLLAIGTNLGDNNLYLCAEKGLNESARILLQNYANPNLKNNQQENTFWTAVLNGNYETALLLRDYNVDMNILNANGETLLHYVYRRKLTQAFEFCLSAGEDANVKNAEGFTVTYLAFFNRDDEVAEKIQDLYKGDINAQDKQQYSLVHHAYKQNDLDRIDYLSKRHIDMNLLNNEHQSVLMMAFLNNESRSNMQFLIDRGSDINTVNENGDTLLHCLFMKDNQNTPYSNIALYLFLIQNNINYNIENKKRQLPISLAIKYCHDDSGFDLLNRDCRINYKESPFEPIVVALKRKSKTWVESLFKHGAYADNNIVGVLSKYIESDFFDYQIFKTIKKIDIFTDGPFQIALYKKYQNVAQDIGVWHVNRIRHIHLLEILIKIIKFL